GPPPPAFATLWRSALGFWIVFHGLSFRPRLAPQLVLLAAAGLALSSIVGLVQFRTGVDLVHALGLREQPAWVDAPGMAGRCGGRGRLAGLWAGVAACARLPGVRARFSSSFDVGANADRVFLWSRAMEIIRDHPLLGIGFGNYPRICGAYYDRVDPTFLMRTWAHNSELSLLAETGPLGLLALLWIAAAAGISLWRRVRAGDGL